MAIWFSWAVPVATGDCCPPASRCRRRGCPRFPPGRQGIRAWTRSSRTRPWTRWDLLSRPSGRSPWKPRHARRSFPRSSCACAGLLRGLCAAWQGSAGPGPGVYCRDRTERSYWKALKSLKGWISGPYPPAWQLGPRCRVGPAPGVLMAQEVPAGIGPLAWDGSRRTCTCEWPDSSLAMPPFRMRYVCTGDRKGAIERIGAHTRVHAAYSCLFFCRLKN